MKTNPQNKDEYLETAKDFNKKVRKWASKVKNISLQILINGTGNKASGRLAASLQTASKTEKEGIWVSAVGFRFNRYGIFRSYGVGRGYVMNNGVLMKGYSAWRFRKIREQYASKGQGEGKIRKMKTYSDGAIRRTPLNYLDAPIESNITELGDIAGEFFGDDTLSHVLNQVNKLTIRK
ncbi:hypothetical protein EZS27_025184 [termite gut metagenome]|uniref:Uncharacterized protein n=1 Tax=termite gut metagenome TaxID=433724 RepID=A0A5J4QUZ5_9ZZZZ